MDYKIIYNNDGSKSLKIDDRLFEYEGQTKFETIWEYVDDSIKLDRHSTSILIEPDGTLFRYNGITEFPTIFRYHDGSTIIPIIDKYILIQANGKLFEYNGITEFDGVKEIYSYREGRKKREQQEQNMLKEIYEEPNLTPNLDYELLDNQQLAQHIIETKTMLEQQKQYMNMLEVEMLARLDSIEEGKLETPYGIFGSRWSKTYYRLDRQALEKALLSVEQTIDDDGEVLENADAKLYTVLKTCRLEPRKTELRKAGFNPDIYYEEMSSTQKLEIIQGE